MAKKNNMKKTIFILGVNSFSGSSFANLMLKKNYKVYGFSRSSIEKKHFLPFDKKNKKFIFCKANINFDQDKIIKNIKKHKPRYIVNYAAQSMVGESWKNPNDWISTNCLGLISLYNEIHKLKLKTRIVHISTPEIYGSVKNKIIENKNYNPSTPYAVSRVTADQYLDIMHRFQKLDYVSVRACNVFGEFQKIYRIIPKIILSIFLKKKLFLHGGGISMRSFIHIDDVSNATYTIMTKSQPGEIYHVTTEKMISIKNLINIIVNKLNVDFNEVVKISKDRIGKDYFYNLSSKKLRTLGWIPKISLEEGIDRVIKWVLENKLKFKRLDFEYFHKK